jgi:hypothetical protein
VTPPCCRAAGPRRARLALLLALAVAAAVLPALARPSDDGAELVAEAMYVCDPLPPGGRDVIVSVAFAREPAAPGGGAPELLAAPRVQLALALSDRVGITADVGLDAGRPTGLDAPGASLKVLLRDPAGGRLGLAASLDVFGARAWGDTELALGLGAIRAVGPVTVRASGSLASPMRGLGPHLHAGASAALALGARWRALAEVVGEVGSGERSLAAGPAVKVQLPAGAALMAGLLFAVVPQARPATFTVQLAHAL